MAKTQLNINVSESCVDTINIDKCGAYTSAIDECHGNDTLPLSFGGRQDRESERDNISGEKINVNKMKRS